LGDILSQNEIDDLLNALNTGEIDVQEMQQTSEKKIKSHDFRRPSKFAKDHLKTLNIIHDNYARLITNFLTGYLRTVIQVDVISVEPLAYSDFSNSISNPAILAVVDFTPLSGSIVFEIAPNIAYAIVDRILGGRGAALEKMREFTEIEIAIIERIIIQILNLMREPWENVVSIRPRLERIETNAQFAQIISPNEMVALITLSARVGEVEGMLNICVPHMVVEPIVSKLSTKFWFSTVEKESTKEAREMLERKIESTKIPIRALLGETKITVGEVIGLQRGDVLPLDTKADDELRVMIGTLEKFKAMPGIKNKKIALKVTGIIEKEEDLNG
jgi:flagellar motor switch protein FliM